MGDFIIGSPLAWALAVKGAAGMFLGRPGWRKDLEEGIALAKAVDTAAKPFVQLYKYQAAVQNGAALISAQDTAHTAAALEIAQRSGNNVALAYALLNRSIALLHNRFWSLPDSNVLPRHGRCSKTNSSHMSLRRMPDIEIARRAGRSGDLDGAIALATTVLDKQFDCGEMISRGPTTMVLAEALLSRGSGRRHRGSRTHRRPAGGGCDGGRSRGVSSCRC